MADPGSRDLCRFYSVKWNRQDAEKDLRELYGSILLEQAVG